MKERLSSLVNMSLWRTSLLEGKIGDGMTFPPIIKKEYIMLTKNWVFIQSASAIFSPDCSEAARHTVLSFLAKVVKVIFTCMNFTSKRILFRYGSGMVAYCTEARYFKPRTVVMLYFCVLSLKYFTEYVMSVAYPRNEHCRRWNLFWIGKLRKEFIQNKCSCPEN